MDNYKKSDVCQEIQLRAVLQVAAGVGEEEEVLEQLLQNAEQRELLSAMLARDKER